MKRALITGVGGQDGSYLAEYLLSLGDYEVHGTLRLTDPAYQKNLQGVIGKVQFHYADLRDEVSLEKVIRRVHPDEIYNLAAQSFVPPSWTQPAETFDVNVGGLARILKIVEKVCPKARVYQASTSEMYGNFQWVHVRPDGTALKLNEDSLMCPVSPYGVAKLAAHKLVDCYRQKGLYVVAGILGNHESPRRGEEMVTRKITRHVARWMVGDWVELRLGNPDSRRDWGFAGDYVKAMYQMLQLDRPGDYVIGTGESHSVHEFLVSAIGIAAKGSMIRASRMWDSIVLNASEFNRPAELHWLVMDYAKAKNTFGWEPKTGFEELVRMMVEADYQTACETTKREAVSV